MNQFSSRIVFSAILAVTVWCSSVDAKDILRWKMLSSSAKSEIMQAVILNEVIFENQALSKCLKDLSDMCDATVGRGFSWTIKGKESDESTDISFKLADVTLAEALEYLATASAASISFNDGRCVIVFPE